LKINFDEPGGDNAKIIRTVAGQDLMFQLPSNVMNRVNFNMPP